MYPIQRKKREGTHNLEELSGKRIRELVIKYSGTKFRQTLLQVKLAAVAGASLVKPSNTGFFWFFLRPGTNVTIFIPKL